MNDKKTDALSIIRDLIDRQEFIEANDSSYGKLKEDKLTIKMDKEDVKSALLLLQNNEDVSVFGKGNEIVFSFNNKLTESGKESIKSSIESDGILNAPTQRVGERLHDNILKAIESVMFNDFNLSDVKKLSPKPA